MARNRGSVKKGALEALAEARRARANAEAREAEARQIAARELGALLLEADGGEVDPAILQDIVMAIVGLGSGAALARLSEHQSGSPR